MAEQPICNRQVPGSSPGPSSSHIEEGVRLIGNVQLGQRVSICAPAEVMGKGSSITIGDGCDIAAYVTISTADSHRRCIGLSTEVERRPIAIGSHVFIGAYSFIGGGVTIGDGTVIGAGTILTAPRDQKFVIPPHSRVRGNPANVEPGYYAR